MLMRGAVLALILLGSGCHWVWPYGLSAPLDRGASDSALDGQRADLRVDLRADLRADHSSDAPVGPPSYHWAKSYGGRGIDGSFGAAIGPDGTVYIAGTFSESVTFGSTTLTSQGGVDNFLASFGPDGAPRWAKGFGSSSDDESSLLTVDANGNVILVGRLQGAATVESTPLPARGGLDAFAVSFSAAGKLRWAKILGGTGTDFADGVAVGNKNDLWITGAYSGTANFGGKDLISSASHDTFVLHLDADGNHLMSAGYGGASSGIAVAVDGAGNAYVTALFEGTLTMPGGKVLTSQGDYDISIFSLDPSGKVRWATRVGGALDDRPSDLAVDPRGNVFVTGRIEGSVALGGQVHASSGSSDFFLCSFDSGGTYRWSKSFGGASADTGRRIAVDPYGSVVVTGLFREGADPGGGLLTSRGNEDIVLASYASSGAFRWAQPFGGVGSDVGYGLAVDRGNNIVLSGWFAGGTVDFGGGALSPIDSADLFVAHLRP